MHTTRRATLISMLAVSSAGQAPQQKPGVVGVPVMPDGSYPRGKSKEQIAEENRAKALKEIDELLDASTQLRDELKKAGVYVTPADSAKKAKAIEKLSRHIAALLRD